MSLLRKIRFWKKEDLTPENVEQEFEELTRQAIPESSTVVTTFTTADTPAKTVTVYDNGTISVE
jgi:hypothetical protein